jgi:hypothetical protein
VSAGQVKRWSIDCTATVGAVYVSREGYFSPSVVANNSLTILPDSRCGR